MVYYGEPQHKAYNGCYSGIFKDAWNTFWIVPQAAYNLVTKGPEKAGQEVVRTVKAAAQIPVTVAKTAWNLTPAAMAINALTAPVVPSPEVAEAAVYTEMVDKGYTRDSSGNWYPPGSPGAAGVKSAGMGFGGMNIQTIAVAGGVLLVAALLAPKK